jgi:hypothetical protein
MDQNAQETVQVTLYPAEYQKIEMITEQGEEIPKR